MSTFAEFCLIALALYLWESTLWLPLRGVALRRCLRGCGWRVLEPDRWLALRETGMVPLPPVAGAGRIAPCQAPPLIVDDEENWLIETGDGRIIRIDAPAWDDLTPRSHHLAVGKYETRLSSPRVLDSLKRARQRGLSPAGAVRLAWRLALSPPRAAREWRRWRMVSGPLGWMCPVLTFGFFAGLPVFYLYTDPFRTLCFAGWLWTVMLFIAAQLWWLGRRVYPGARPALRMDALLAAIVPFHAMRARELAAVHAMGATHPAALILATGDTRNPWLAAWIRNLAFPRPGQAADAIASAALTAPVNRALARRSLTVAAFSTPPEAGDDPNAVSYCPRCHSRYLPGVETCPDCRGLPVRPLPGR